jgi:hypothetical protein
MPENPVAFLPAGMTVIFMAVVMVMFWGFYGIAA